ncbi:hypothetical protein [Actinomadura macrotermitis]|uniref:Uncharacterized protein n=1 Tax=Actinomadura macrotermitis TaxID=2585200 RepID=A0A7K0BSI6_9ACTN|nr:hypothetical protein [Actinomadura macrotermitis]MQY04139.1 hypothetical protein [Actinomadura macrotermitis]
MTNLRESASQRLRNDDLAAPGRLDEAGELDALRAEFPGWSFLISDQGRWWALRTGPHAVSEVITDGPALLREQLLEIRVVEQGR